MFEHSMSCAIAALPLAARAFSASMTQSDGRFGQAPQMPLRLRGLSASGPATLCRGRTRQLKRPGL
ncbi:hypothetical protein JR065_19455 [Xanthomonas sp. AmX2]|uniref:hypothetical protein n=1 Tax=Xanthomonas sp. TaxID=29446 RepID=UPI00197F11F8|nr:hypothetical protein [Xanthomonas sp.]MBN6152514.1 hypothetical protein [Xanthomonas sp.]